jgi:hypothetical protein
VPGASCLLGLQAQGVGGALDSVAPAIQHVGIEHRGADALVAQELLDGADVVAPYQEVGRERMALMPSSA